MSKELSPQQLQKLAQSMSDMGRYGDTQLVHVNEDEVELLKKIGAGTRNPQTGLLEFFGGKSATTFDEAFAVARDDQGAGGTFDYNGKSYSTNYANESSGTTSTSSGEYTSVLDRFDGGGAGGSGDSYFSGSHDEYKAQGGTGGQAHQIDSSGNETNDDRSTFERLTGYKNLKDTYDGGGKGMSGATYGHGTFHDADTSGDGIIQASEASAYGGLKGGIDGNNDSTFSSVMNVAAFVASPVAYLAGKAINTALDFDKDGSMFTKGGSFSMPTQTEAQKLANQKSLDNLGSNNDGDGNAPVTVETIEEETSDEAISYSDIEGDFGYNAFSSSRPARSFIKYDYEDGTGNPVETYNRNTKPFHIATSAESARSYALNGMASNAIEQMMSMMPRELMDNLEGDFSVHLTDDDKLALVVGNGKDGYIEATYDAKQTGYDSVMSDLANMFAYMEASSDTKIDAGFMGRVASSERFDGVATPSLSASLEGLKSEIELYSEGTPQYRMAAERMDEIEREIARRTQSGTETTSSFSIAALNTAIAGSANNILQASA